MQINNVDIACSFTTICNLSVRYFNRSNLINLNIMINRFGIIKDFTLFILSLSVVFVSCSTEDTSNETDSKNDTEKDEVIVDEEL